MSWKRLVLGLMLAAGIGGARADVQVIEEERRYLLDASTATELADQLARHGVRHGSDDASRSHGLTEAGIETRYELDADQPGACVLRDLRVRVRLIRTLPEWKPRTPPKPELVEAVGAMLRGLATHEDGHRRHVLASATAVDRALGALPAAPECTQLRRDADRIASRALIRLQMREMYYDLATEKGRKQGAVLQLERSKPPSTTLRGGRRLGGT